MQKRVKESIDHSLVSTTKRALIKLETMSRGRILVSLKNENHPRINKTTIVPTNDFLSSVIIVVARDIWHATVDQNSLKRVMLQHRKKKKPRMQKLCMHKSRTKWRLVQLLKIVKIVLMNELLTLDVQTI